MEKRTGREAAPLGVIGCAMAGFELVGRNLWLVLFPIALDLLLWLGPRLSISPLLETANSLLRAQFGADPAFMSQMAQLGELLDRVGQEFSLVSLLSGLPLFTVPSLLANYKPGALSPLGDVQIHMLNSLLSSLAWGAGLLLAGLVLGVLFLDLVARQVIRARPSPRQALAPGAMAAGDGQVLDVSYPIRAFRVLAFVGAMLVLVACVLPVWVVLLGMALMVAPLLGVVMWILSIGVVSYVGLHLLFVAHAVLLAGRGLVRAIWESVVLIHSQLPSVAGLVVLIAVVHQGLGQVWSLPQADSWLLLVGILGNACIATGLTATTFVFYEQRMPQVLEAVRKRRQLVRV